MNISALVCRRICLFVVVTCAVVLPAAVALRGSRTSASGDEGQRIVQWLNNFEQAQSVARQTGKPIFVMFR